MSAMIPEMVCKKLVAEYFRRVRCDEKPAVILRELINVVYAQGFTAGQSALAVEPEPATEE